VQIPVLLSISALWNDYDDVNLECAKVLKLRL